nr:dead-box atp-dependent rna helicase 10 [Quercus suber]
MVEQTINLAKQPHIIVGTPEGLVDHISNMNGFSLHTMKYLVLDEADRLLNEEFEESVDEIMKVIPHERRTSLFSATMTEKVLDEADRLLNEEFEESVDEIMKVIPHERRTSLFSATMTEKVKKLQRDCLRNPVKECYLAYILTEMSGCTSVVFTRNCKATHFLTIMLRHLGLRAIPISGRMSQITVTYTIQYSSFRLQLGYKVFRGGLAAACRGAGGSCNSLLVKSNKPSSLNFHQMTFEFLPCDTRKKMQAGNTCVQEAQGSCNSLLVKSNKPSSLNFHQMTFEFLPCDTRKKMQAGNTCVQEAQVVSSRTLKRASPYCSTHTEAYSGKTRGIEKEGEHQRVISESTSPLDVVAYPQANLG